MKKNTTYTEEDFKTAVFARHPYGRIAARVDSGNLGWWAGGNERAEPSWMDDDDMAEEGFVPVREARENDKRAARLKRHIADVEAVVKRRGEDIERLEAEKAELREHVARLKKAQPITLDDLRDAWDGAGRTLEYKAGDEAICCYGDDDFSVVRFSADRVVTTSRFRLLHRATKPKRPEGAEQLSLLIQQAREASEWADDADAWADWLAERGVRVTGGGDG